MDGILRRVNVSGIAVVLAVLVFWEILAVRIFDFTYLSPPTEIAEAIVNLTASGELTSDVAYTLGIAMLASAIALALGAVLGMAVGLIASFRAYSMASIDVFRTIPVTALAPVALLVWGPTAKCELIVAVYAATWPMLMNTASGVRTVHPRLHEVALMFRFSHVATVRKVILPVATPAMLVGGRLAIVTALVVAIIAEMLINPHGLGWGLVEGQHSLQPARTWAYAVVAGILGYVLNALLVAGVRRALPGAGATMGAAGRP